MSAANHQPTPKTAAISPSRRDQFIDKRPVTEQVAVLKWAENHQIKPNDPLWLLVDLLGISSDMTAALPAQMQAAGQQAVEAIAAQRQLEADAFARNTQQALKESVRQITHEVITATTTLTERRLSQQLWQHSLLVAGGLLMLAAMSFCFGYALSHFDFSGFVPNNPYKNSILHGLHIILAVPIGYLILPLLLAGSVWMFVYSVWRYFYE